MLALPKEEVLDIQDRLSQLVVSQETTIMVLSKHLGKLAPSHETDKHLTGKNNTKSTISDRIKMVERKFTSSKWQASEDWNTKINNSNGCF